MGKDVTQAADVAVTAEMVSVVVIGLGVVTKEDRGDTMMVGISGAPACVWV